MSNSKITGLTSATTPLSGSEVLPISQSGVTTQVSVANLTAGRAVSALNYSLGTYGYTDGNYLGLANTNPSAYGARLVVGSYSETSATLNQVYLATSKAILQMWADGNTNANGAFISAGWANGGQGPLNLQIGSTTTLQLAASGDVGYKTGNLVQGTASKGVNFTANTPASGMTSQLLNWYETGTFTPTAQSQTGTITTSSGTGVYTKIGNVITVQVSMTLTNVGTAGGVLYIDGLPFTSKNVSGRSCVFMAREDNNTGTAYQGIIVQNATYAQISTLSNGAVAWLNTNVYTFCATYHTAS
jgi:hypothetical protein